MAKKSLVMGKNTFLQITALDTKHDFSMPFQIVIFGEDFKIQPKPFPSLEEIKSF